MSDRGYSDIDQSRRDIPSFIEPRPPLILNPFMRPRPEKGINLMELFEEDSESEEPEWLQVYLRMKPCNERNNLYEVKSDKSLITSLDTATAGHGRRTQHNVSKMYTFSHIFGSESSQREVFEQVVKTNLKKLPEGHSFTLLTYGASGSGKTYTLMGTVQSPGLVPRSLEYVFRVVEAAALPIYKPANGEAEKLSYAAQEYELQWVKKLRQVSAPLRDKFRRMSVQLHGELTSSMIDLTNRKRYYVWVSFVEIYNETIYDLLTTVDRNKSSSKLRIREDSNGNAYVKGATQAFVRTGEEAYDVLVAGKHNLQVAATGVHAQSSRSHCIFTITMITETEEGVSTSCVRLCDLAGCERARNTRNTGARMQESRAINSSLHVLERCLHMLRRKQRHNNTNYTGTIVPYRESKLTRLLGAGLSGARGEAVSMVVTLNPSARYALETKHVLQLAAVAKDIQVNSTIAESSLESSVQDATLECSAEVMKLRADNDMLHFELAQAQSRIRKLTVAMEEKQAESARTMSEMVESAKAFTSEYYESKIEMLRKDMDEMREEYEMRIQQLEQGGQPRSSLGTTSREEQHTITQLSAKIVILEERLAAEKLARANAEEEIQHLRACIEERDEKSSDEPVTAVEDTSESDSEDDPCNESLEPSFRKEDIDRSRLRMSMVCNDLKDDVTANRDADKTVNTIENNSVAEISKDTLVDGDCSTSECEDNSSDLNEDTRINYSNDGTRVMNDEDSKNTKVSRETYCVSDVELKSTSVYESDRSVDETYFVKDVATKNEGTCKKTSFTRGTYVVMDLSNVGNGSEMFSFNTEETRIDERPRDVEKIKSQNNGTKQELDNEIAQDPFARIEIIGKKIEETSTFNNNLEEKPVALSTVIGKKTGFVESENSLVRFERLETIVNKNDAPKNPNNNFETANTADRVVAELVSINKCDKSLFHFEQLNSAPNRMDESKEMNNVFEKPKSRLLNKVLAKQSTSESDISLAQFEQLEKAANKKETNPAIETLIDVKILQDKRAYFGDSLKTESDKGLETNVSKNKTYFDYTDKHVHSIKVVAPAGHEKGTAKETMAQNIVTDRTDVIATTKIAELKTIHLDIDRSPSIVKDDMTTNFEPNKIKKLLGESFTRQSDIFGSIVNAGVPKKQLSGDIFESPQIFKTRNDDILECNEPVKISVNIEEVCNKETVHNDIIDHVVDKLNESLKIQDSKTEKCDVSSVGTKTGGEENEEDEVFKQSLPDDTTNQLSTEIKTDYDICSNLPPLLDAKPHNEIITDNNMCFKQPILVDAKPLDDVIIESDVISQRQDKNETTQDLTLNATRKENNTVDDFENIFNNITAPRPTEFDTLVTEQACKQDGKTNSVSERKYNLRHKTDRQLAENFTETKPKRNLRLRRRKPDDSESDNTTKEQDSKLKDIVNLQKEFSDVTLDIPAIKKDVKDIQSPERCDENLKPNLDTQSCPAKSVPRSRRKLFTPRAEPLEDSAEGEGDSHERVCIPRPSYQRGGARARRKLAVHKTAL